MNNQKPSGYQPYQRFQPKKSSGDVVDTKECKDCHATFDIIQGERDFYKEKVWPEPGRCPACRAARKAEARK